MHAGRRSDVRELSATEEEEGLLKDRESVERQSSAAASHLHVLWVLVLPPLSLSLGCPALSLGPGGTTGETVGVGKKELRVATIMYTTLPSIKHY